MWQILPELCFTIIVLEAIPAHHVKDVEDAIALAEHAVQDSVLVLAPTLVSIPAREVAWEAFDLLPTLAVHFGRSIRSNNKVSPTLHIKGRCMYMYFITGCNIVC